MNDQRFVVTDAFWKRLEEHLPGTVVADKELAMTLCPVEAKTASPVPIQIVVLACSRRQALQRRKCDR